MMISYLVASVLLGNLSSPLYGTAYDDLRFPAVTLSLGFGNPPASVTFATDGAGSVGVLALEFGAEAVNEEQVFFNVQMPHAWREGTDLSAHIHISPEDATTCNYRACIEYYIANPNANFPANTTITCTTFASGEVALEHDLVGLGTISMTGKTLSAMLLGRFYRNSSHAEDTCEDSNKVFYLHEIDFHYEIDRPGSRQTLVK